MSDRGMTDSATGLYRDSVKPKLVDLLAALKLDAAYARADGNYLYDASGAGYLDMVGGFGAALFGHSHPELRRVLVDAVAAGVPQHTQVSVGVEAGRLAAQLNRLIGGTTGYCAIFANSGAECVEAALKHAYFVHIDVVQRNFDRAWNLTKDECDRLEDAPDGKIKLPPGIETIADLRVMFEAENRSALETCVSTPIVVALEGSFHGKSSAALKVTHNERIRGPFEGLSAIVTRFIDPERPDLLRTVVEENIVHFKYPSVSGGRLTVRSLPVARVFAFILEPILGEGGIRLVPDESMASLARQHSELKVPFVVDEIQTGCGRTGSVFCFKETPLGAIEPEYILLSKALGGGLTKIGVTLIKKSVYNEDFGLLHGSTFAEDGLACRIARASLDLLTRDNGRLLKRVSETGCYIRAELDKLSRQHRATIADVRGKGLMLGVEFRPLRRCSRFLAEASRQGVLPLLIASYIHHYHRIRLMPPLGCALPGASTARQASILRLQPPVTVTRPEVDRIIVALNEVLTIIERNNEHCLLAHLWGDRVPETERRNPASFVATTQDIGDAERPDVRVGFVLHPPEIGHIVSHFMPSLDHYGWSRGAVERWWSQAARFLDPVWVHQARIKSRGRTVGVFGISYGGYMAVRALLLAPEVYKVGVAVSPISDMKHHPGNERILGALRDNRGVYEYASNLNLAAQLKGRLLVIHGTSDSAVPFFHTMRFLNALTRADKQYDLIVLPEQGHVPPGDYWLDAVRRHFVENLTSLKEGETRE